MKKAREKSTLITDAFLRRWALPSLDEKLGKDSRGTVLVVGGSQEVPGAVILAAVGALRAGAGRLQIATSQSVAQAVAIAVPEARVIGLRQTRKGELAVHACRVLRDEAPRCDALLVGPGMTDPRAATDLLELCIAADDPGVLVVDAAPLQLFSRKKRRVEIRGSRIIATPHPGEMAKLWGIERDEVLARPAELAREAAAHLGIIVVLKGARTHIAAPDGTLLYNTAGNFGLGTSGSGDTLSGIIAGLSARGAEPLQAAAWGVYLHAKAGEVLAKKCGPLGFLARELVTEIPPILAKLSGPRR